MKGLVALLVLSVGLLLAAACVTPAPTPTTTPVLSPTSSPTGQPRQVEVGREFTLKVGEYVEVATAYFLVTFNGVTQDSRCPSDVVCVRAGSVTAEIEALASDGWPNTLKLTIGDDGSPTAQFRSYFITATAVHPYPISTTTIDPKEYEVTLIVQTFR